MFSFEKQLKLRYTRMGILALGYSSVSATCKRVCRRNLTGLETHKYYLELLFSPVASEEISMHTTRDSEHAAFEYFRMMFGHNFECPGTSTIETCESIVFSAIEHTVCSFGLFILKM